LVKKCPVCGFENRDDANFCANCGAPLAAPPTVKPVPSVRVVSPTAPGGAVKVSPPGMCYYHPNIPASYICARCGRPICKYCARFYNGLVLCPQCYETVARAAEYAPQMAAPAPAPPPPAPPPPAPAAYPPTAAPPPPPTYPPARAMWGFIISLIAGIVIIINSAALLSASFCSTLASMLPWITCTPTPWNLVAIGIILGIIVAIGSLLMVMGYGTIGSIVVFPAAVISLIMGGGFIVGFILGILGGIMGMLGK